MKLQTLRWIALISGSLANIWNLIMVMFIGANLINDLSADVSLLDMVYNIFIFLCLILSLVSIILSWFKSKIGGFLITISGIIVLLVFLIEKISDFLWSYDVVIIQVVLILSGLLLLYYALKNERILK